MIITIFPHWIWYGEKYIFNVPQFGFINNLYIISLEYLIIIKGFLNKKMCGFVGYVSNKLYQIIIG